MRHQAGAQPGREGSTSLDSRRRAITNGGRPPLWMAPLAACATLLLCREAAGDGLLNVPQVFQQQDHWCWAGSSQAVLAHAGTSVGQCEIVNWAWDRDDCCNWEPFFPDKECDKGNWFWGEEHPGNVQEVLAHWNVTADPSARLTEEEVRSEIDAGRPFIIGWENPSGGEGHAVVGRGIVGDTVYLMNPWPDNGYEQGTYDWVVSSPQHSWTFGLTIRPPLTVELSASPGSGAAPLATNLTAQAGGTATGTLNYTFWWHCPNTTTSVSSAMAACGSIPTPPWGGCTSSSYGYKCDGVTDDPKTVSHTYSSAGTYTAKVIVERGTAPPDQALTTISTSANLGLSVSVTGSGSVTSNTGGINCPGTCWANYSSGSLVTLTAHTGSGATFTGWGGDCWGTSSCTVTMSSARNVTATFSGSTPGSYWLTLAKAGTGGGTVTSSPAGINCGSTCSASYTSSTTVTLTRSAASGSTFAGWGGACSGGASTCTVTMSAARSVTATFNQTTGPQGNTGQLIRQVGHDEVFWLQHGYIYHVADETIMVAMAGMPGWGWDKVTEVGSLPYVYGPAFIMSSSSSNGLLIRQKDTFEVYWMQNGERRWVACEAALPSVGSFADVIEVSSTIINSVVPDRGDDYGDGCPCTGYAISPGSLPSNPPSSAGSRSFDVTGIPYGCSGNWTAWDDGGWLRVSSTGSSLSAGDKTDSLTVSWTANTSQSPRSSSVTVADHYLPLTQQGAPVPTCTSFDISPQYVTAGSSAGQQSAAIIGYPSGCQGKSWTASSGSWVSVSPSFGSGPRSVTVSWAQNGTSSSRVESVAIAGKTFTVSQGPANQPPVANAGLDQVVPMSALVTLNGSGSSDPDSGPSPLSYAWSQVSGPAVTLSGATTVFASFTPPSAGTYIFQLRVSDGDAQGTDQVTVTAAPGVASYDSNLEVPKCGSIGSVCDSGSLLVGRASLGPEPHQPNTIYGSCADGTEGMLHSDESNDRIRVSTLDGTSFAAGKAVQVEATVWAWSDPSTDSLEIYQAADANSPVWTLVATLTPTAAGTQTLSTTYTLPASSLQAVRARFRWTGSAGACGAGAFDDHDDLVFAVGAPTTQGWISGKVTDAATGVSLAGVQVSAFDSAGLSVGQGLSNSSGFYSVSTGVTSGTYYVRTTSGGDYVDELYDGLDCPGGVCTVTRGTPIGVTAGTTTSGIDFALGRGGRISGMVRDATTGLPLADIGVYIFTPASGYWVASAYTDSSGVYAVTGLPSGTYYARTWDWVDYVDELYDDVPCPGWSCGLSGGAPISVTAGATTTGIDFGLVRGGRVSGTVTDGATGQPLAGVRVQIYSSGGLYVTSETTDGSGSYTTVGLSPATYYASTSNAQGYLDELYDNISCPGGSCFVTSGTAVAVTAAATTPNISFALLRGGQISGTVTDAGTSLPLSGVSVHIYGSSGSHVARASTDSSGSYSSPGLPAGVYYAETASELGYFDELFDDVPCPGSSCTVTSGTPIVVTAGTTATGIDFALVAGGRISGTVTDSATGLPLAGVWIDVYDAYGNWVTYGSTDSSGAFTTSDGLPSGTYYASSWNSLGYVDELYDDIPCPSATCAVTSGVPISVAGGVTGGIHFALARGGRVSGTVTDGSTGLPLVGVWVRIYDGAGNIASYDTTDASGAYTTEAVPAGTYYARTSNSAGYMDELYDNIPCAAGVCTVTSGSPVTVTAGSTTGGVDFALAGGGRISGTVTDAATGLPLAGVQVRLYNAAGTYLTYGYSNSSGVYVTAAGLSFGTYYARTSNGLGYIEELYEDTPCPGGACTVTGGTPVTVALGSTTTGIDFGLAQGGRIAGTAKDAATGLPLSGLMVRVFNSVGAYVTYGYTDSAGNYTTSSGLVSGTYRARTSSEGEYVDEAYNAIPCPGGSCSTTSGTLINVTAGSTTPGINFALAKGGRISGTVKDEASALPLAGVEVDVYDGAGSYVTYGYTDASGVYTTSSALPSGTYRARTWNWAGYVDEAYDAIFCPGGSCSTTSGTLISVTAGSTTPGINFDLARGGRVSGTVTDAATGSPVVGAHVSILDADGRSLGSGTTNTFGVYTTPTGLPSGTYYARTKAPGYLDELYNDVPCLGGACPVTSGTSLPVTAGSTTAGVDFALAPAPTQTNDEIAGATLVSGLPYTAIEDTRTATTNPSDPVHTCATGTQDSNSVWFRYVAGFTGAVRVDTFTSNYDTVLTAYAGTTSVGPELACNDDTNGTTQSEILLDVTSGQTYLIEVTGYGRSGGGTLILSVGSAPPTVTSGFATAVGQYGVTLVGWVNPRGTSTTTSFEYGPTTAYGGTVAAPTLEGSTVQAVCASIEGLTCATTYHFRALGTNAGGTASGADVPFATTACPLPTLSVSDATVVEGDAGSTMATLTVSLSSASSQTVTVAYTTADDTATAGSDYLTTFGLLTIPAGSVSENVSIAVNGDHDYEPDETFFLNLSSPTNATLTDAQGVVTITNDDPVPTLSIGDVTVRRGTTGTTIAELPVTLSAATYQTVTVAYATADGTATAGTDYVSASGEVSFPPGVTTATVSVAVSGSSTADSRSFFVDLANPVNAGIADGRGEAILMAEGFGFYTVAPCRSVDTRNPAPGTPLAAGVPRTFAIAGTCGIPLTARAVSLNLTVTGATSNGNVRLYPGGTATPTTSTINFTAGRTSANNAVVLLGTDGDLAALLSPAGTAQVIIDVNGYFE
jgi:5-hydroxyisourate hydrolase-like protein (transthyretin family)